MSDTRHVIPRDHLRALHDSRAPVMARTCLMAAIAAAFSLPQES